MSELFKAARENRFMQLQMAVLDSARQMREQLQTPPSRLVVAGLLIDLLVDVEPQLVQDQRLKLMYAAAMLIDEDAAAEYDRMLAEKLAQDQQNLDEARSMTGEAISRASSGLLDQHGNSLEKP